MCLWECFWKYVFFFLFLNSLTIPVNSQVYRQDCETFGMVVKMLVAKDPNLEKQLQVPLRENLGEIRERCLEDLKHFISELDEAVRQPEPSVCDSTTPSTSLGGHKLSKTAVNHSSSYWHVGPICFNNVRLSIVRLTAEHDRYLGIIGNCWTEAILQHSNQMSNSALREDAVLHVCMWGWTVLVLNGAFLHWSSLLKVVGYKILLKVVFLSDVGKNAFCLFKKLLPSHHIVYG